MIELIKNLENKKSLSVIISLSIIVFITIFKVIIKETHAYYNYDSGWVPIFTGKVGNFSGKGDSSPLNRNTDINVMYYVQDITNPKQYTIMIGPPIEYSDYALDGEKSNCIPKETTGAKYPVHTIDNATGEVKISITQSSAHQVVCRIYYSYKNGLKDGIILFALQEDNNGNVIHGDKKYKVVTDIPTSGYNYQNYECTNKDVVTEVSYDVTNGFKYKTTKPNVCYAYFNKS